MNTKVWYLSKTLIFNILFTVGLLLQLITGHTVFSPEAQALVITLFNAFLRIISNGKVSLVDDKILTTEPISLPIVMVSETSAAAAQAVENNTAGL
jgi:hypothetical protein